MNILQVINAYNPPYSSGGAAFICRNISEALANKKHNVTVYTTNILSKNSLFSFNSNKYTYNKVNIYYFKNNIFDSSNIFYYSNDLVKYIKNNASNFDLIHLHEYRSYLSLAITYYANKYKIPVILQAHGQVPKLVGKKSLKYFFDFFFSKKILSNVSMFIALNQMEADQYLNLGISERKIAVIPNGIEFTNYINLPIKGSFKKDFNIDSKEKIVLFLGRLNRIKGINFLIKSFVDVKKEKKNVKLVIVGPDDGYLQELKCLVRDLKFTDEVLFTGPLYGIKKLAVFVDSDVVVLPSVYEVFPMTLLEAYSCSKPIIASDIDGLRDLVKNGVTGFLFKPGDIQRLTKEILELLNNDYKSREMGKMGNKFVKQYFTIDRVVDKLLEVYQKVI